MKALLRGSLSTVVASIALLSAPAAFAAGETCFNDTDCPGGGGDVCGGDVCDWNKANAMGTSEKPYTCVSAGTGAKGADGWCTTNDNCKCRGQGAKCVGVYCTFTKASDAPAVGGSAATGGTNGTAGSTSSTPGGTSTTTGGTGSGTGTTAPAAEDDGGCSVSAPGKTAGGAVVAFSLLGLASAFARRRRAH